MHEGSTRLGTVLPLSPLPLFTPQALSLSPTCPEAYNVLAVAQATTYEEALELYRKAVELGPQVRGCGCWVV